jgi:transposase
MHFETRFRTRLKIFFFDGTGVCILTKRLEEGSFSWRRSADVQSNKISLTPEALSLLTDGVDLRGAKMRPWYEREA